MTGKRSTRWETVREGDLISVAYRSHEGVTKAARGRVATIKKTGTRVYMMTKEHGVITWFDINDAPRFVIEQSAPINPEPMFEVA